ncbi:hypothetical protein CVT24_012485 [Panaeolus cyanescens]|uniref:Protein-S-isoprenylcysteine O-methyltransferase n=1 Tax=Panaeolus cyanescens TaxID=181874 RepID=A0A409YK07_9AGAR|nr:hypothetical protein CVT24_012485 [Panaeolus cyanescens]
MTLERIPLVLATLYVFARSVTPPNPPPPKEDLIDSKHYLASKSSVPLRFLAVSGSILHILLALIEAAVIWGANYPDSVVGQAAINLFIFKHGSALAVRTTPINFIGAMGMFFGGLLRLWSFHTLGRHFRFEASIQDDHELITWGPYAYVRHPAYTGLFLSNTGWFLWNYGSGSWMQESGLLKNPVAYVLISIYGAVVVFGVLTWIPERTNTEDEALRSRFTRQWDQWAEKVPYLLIPGVY